MADLSAVQFRLTTDEVIGVEIRERENKGEDMSSCVLTPGNHDFSSLSSDEKVPILYRLPST